ncbi:hypothetical protein L0244_10260 [bacterium]|nr:hypothetical protein [bacterium]
MHDWTLIYITVDWLQKRIECRFKNSLSEEVSLIANQFNELHVPRYDEWGPSVSVNKVSGPIFTGSGNQVLKIEMQTGDIIEIVAKSIDIPE